jgi:hypothetical protein
MNGGNGGLVDFNPYIVYLRNFGLIQFNMVISFKHAELVTLYLKVSTRTSEAKRGEANKPVRYRLFANVFQSFHISFHV